MARSRDARAALAQLGELALDAVLMMPIRVPMTKMPPRVTASIASRNPNEPASPPIVPGSSVRIRLIHSRSLSPVPGLAVEDRDDERDHDHADHGDHEQPDDQRDRAAGHVVVEGVAHPLAAGGLVHAILGFGPGR